MYRILIVDDDLAARRGLSNCVDWVSLDAKVCGFACNGREALAFIEQNQVDIVISDVRMPFMDGLELSRVLMNQYKDIRVLLISGYGEIDYLKAALNAQVIDYILKPVKVTELMKAVQRAQTAIKRYRQDVAERQKLEDSFQRSLPLLQERFLVELLEDSDSTEDAELLERGTSLNLPIAADSYFVLLALLPQDGIAYHERQLTQMRLREAVENTIVEVQRHALIVPLSQDQLAIVDMCETEPEERLKFAGELLHRLQQTMDMDVDIGLGVEVSQLHRLSFSCRVARQALEQRYFEGHNRLLEAYPHLYELQECEPKWDGGNRLRQTMQKSSEEASRYLTALYDQMKRTLPAARIHYVTRQILMTAMLVQMECGTDQTEAIQGMIELIGRVETYDTVDALQFAVGIKHFQRLLTDSEALNALRNTLIISLYRFAVLFPAPIILALMLNEVVSKGYKRGIQIVVYLPHFLSWVVAGSMLLTLLSYNGGLVNELLRMMGLPPVNFLSDKTKFRSILVISGAWKDVGWNSILYLAAITGIDPLLYEAAEIDGAGRAQKIWHVTLPGIADTIVVLMLLRIGSMMASNMDQVLMLYNPLVYETGDVIDTYVYRQGISKMEYSFSTAVGLFNSVVGFLLLIIANTTSKKISERGIW